MAAVALAMNASAAATAGAAPTSFLEVGDGRVAYEDSGGSGPLVVCVPGMGDVRQQFRFLAPALASAGYRVVTMDLRGMGESSVDWPDYSAAAIGSDIVALIAHLGAGRAFVIGNSMAAAAAVWAAAQVPDRISGLVLIGPFVRDIPAAVVERAGAQGRDVAALGRGFVVDVLQESLSDQSAGGPRAIPARAQ